MFQIKWVLFFEREVNVYLLLVKRGMNDSREIYLVNYLVILE